MIALDFKWAAFTRVFVPLTSSSWWRSVRHWKETGSSSCGWKPSRCWALQCRWPARHASSATAMTTPEETAAGTQSIQVSKNVFICTGSASFLQSLLLSSTTNSMYSSLNLLWSALTLILPKSICFWMVYICSVLSIRLAPSLQLVTNCWNNNHNNDITAPSQLYASAHSQVVIESVQTNVIHVVCTLKKCNICFFSFFCKIEGISIGTVL